MILRICTYSPSIILIGLAVLVGACREDTLPTAAGVASEADDDVIAGKAMGSSADAFVWFGTSTPVDGASATLVRNRNGVRLNLKTAGLEPGHVYSVWLVAFEHPDKCVDGCGMDDFANPAADATVFGSVAGSVVGGTGKATLAGHVKPGDPTIDILEGDGSLDNPLTAEIHFVIRTHGPKIQGMVHDQAATFNAGCLPGEPNEGMCRNVQVAVFM